MEIIPITVKVRYTIWFYILNLSLAIGCKLLAELVGNKYMAYVVINGHKDYFCKPNEYMLL